MQVAQLGCKAGALPTVPKALMIVGELRTGVFSTKYLRNEKNGMRKWNVEKSWTEASEKRVNVEEMSLGYAAIR